MAEPEPIAVVGFIVLVQLIRFYRPLTNFPQDPDTYAVESAYLPDDWQS
jgi:hypothetical protein